MAGARWTGGRRSRAAAAVAVAWLMTGPPAAAQNGPGGGALQRIRETGQIRFGYHASARPFSYVNDSNEPAGYAVALCRQVADEVKSALKLPALEVTWVPLPLEQRIQAVQQRRIDLLCGADAITLAKRSEVSFSIPIFAGGIGALVRSDAPARLRDVLAGHGRPFQPTWRAAAARLLQTREFLVVSGTTAHAWLTGRFDDLGIIASVLPVADHEAGVRALSDRKGDVFLAERAVLLDAARRRSAPRDLVVIDRLFTQQPLGFALARGDEDFRLLVDRALSRVYRSGEIGALYASAFGEPDEQAIAFFRWNALAN